MDIVNSVWWLSDNHTGKKLTVTKCHWLCLYSPNLDFDALSLILSILYSYVCIYIYIYIYICIYWECWSSVNHYVVMCRTKCNIIWRVLNIYDRAIIIIIIIMIINKYILYIYIFNPWKILFCNLRFLEVYNNIHQAIKKMEWNGKSKVRQNTDKTSMSVSMCVYMGVGVCVGMWMRAFKLSQARNLKHWL